MNTSGHESVIRSEVIAAEPTEAMAGILDIDPPEDGQVPELWHWLHLLERRPTRDLGPDGHPTSGIPAPPEPGHRRMFAGGRVDTIRRLRIGVEATRRSWVSRTVEKQGRSGPLTFVTVRHEISQDGALAIAEEQDIVYRAPGGKPLPTDSADGAALAPPGSSSRGPAGEVAGASPGSSARGPAGASLGGADRATLGDREAHLVLPVDQALLFRFSALTYNAHRIHYDLGWVRHEGYDDLVVHGPLQALLMGELARRAGRTLVGRRFAYRLVSPMIGPQPIHVYAAEAGLSAGAEVCTAAGRRTAVATFTPLAPD